MSKRARRELVWSQAKRYRDARRGQKTVILDEFCEATGLNRKYAIGLLNRPPVEGGMGECRHRGSPYVDTVEPLTRLWEICGRLCGKRLVAAIPTLLESLLRHGEMSVSEESRQLLCRLSASTIDRLLRPVRRKLGWRGRTTTKPGTLLKQQIAVRTFADWDERRPGFFEVDLVAHCGGSGHGDYAYSLNLTDVHTAWTDMEALPNRSQQSVCQAIERVRKRLPFAMLGIDSDNGSEFINWLLKGYCVRHQLTFTRCRPYKKNDQCHVESKNWSVIRVHAGYCRYDTPEALAALRRLYSWLRPLVNYFQPSLKLREKVRDGARVTKRHERAATPYERLAAADVLTQEQTQELQEVFLSLNPAEIHRRIQAAQAALYQTASRDPQGQLSEADGGSDLGSTA
ncbi:MAG: DDE-type integrase/transposase/recombinase [Chthonomonadales bacterium]|nr:DDE-type integrase/transposase/recombinase [Chthonomonadales bacterium]